MMSLGLMNGPFGFCIALCLFDGLNVPIHMLRQCSLFAPFCQVSEYRQIVKLRRHLLPLSRGYIDKCNRHPFEQVVGYMMFLVALRLTAAFVGLHAGAAWCCALGWCLCDVSDRLMLGSGVHLPLPFPVYPKDRKANLRRPKMNFGIATSIWDRLLGKYMTYEKMKKPVVVPQAKKWYESMEFHKELDSKDKPTEGSRPQAFASPWAVVGFIFGLFFSTLFVEIYQTDGQLPRWHDYAHFMKAIICLINLTMVCAAVDSASKVTLEPEVSRRQDGRPSHLFEAVPEGHVKKFTGGKDVWKGSAFEVEKPKPYKRE